MATNSNESHFQVASRCGASPEPQSGQPQWIPEDICCHQAFVLLERYDDTNFVILQKLHGKCHTKG